MEERIVIKKVVFKPTCGEGGGPILCISEVKVPDKVPPDKSEAPLKMSAYEVLRNIFENNSPT
ncbi:hypothetical protein A2361_00280 [Candidatus Woesebacteria bacterium RIFOXYB1_FULL_40_26]|uniref:Uncharacterized protein n=3 Tax=Candidatus Woeseibacteriota TaxID=1752722 RepID=A0A1F8DIQ6_9BACT|nr:MAG: hypothetical protein UT72_C0032G0006 [Candidatus Woesebacteria bacterium GW2011_GWB1_40_101]OGM81791.1 MAG: hypothetical protein A2361_00280 [Candidatus Woesebacteria bacterium RIFOXYB1_FULL_40_26]OGM88521.1 MAG: hypothetical protein A2614_00915 [Candidatus Woesebacteria bacterium RIFOXYD1_FULL_40_21]